jgi:segregation and condensation protein B
VSIKAKLEAIIYAAEDPITLDQMASLLKDDLLALKTALPQGEESGAESQSQFEQAEDHLGAVEESAPAPPAKKTKEKSEKVELRGLLKPYLEELIADYANPEHGIEIREVASGYRMSTKPEHHDVVRAFSKSLKPPIRL